MASIALAIVWLVTDYRHEESDTVPASAKPSI
jgi:hypothetical protein